MHIRTVPTITISDYVKGQKINYETPEPSVVDLVIDKGKNWSFISDDVTKAQSDIAYVEKWTQDAAMQMKIAIETAVYADIYADTHASNTGTTAGVISGDINLGAAGSPIQLAKNTVIDKIVECGQILDEQNVPEDGRWMLVPSWMRTLIMTSDLKNASIMGDGKSTLRTGRLGEIDKFTLYSSNLLSKSTETNTPTRILFGHKTALTFATQLVENEGPMRDVSFYGDFYRGLQVYGYKVIKPESLGMLFAYK